MAVFDHSTCPFAVIKRHVLISRVQKVKNYLSLKQSIEALNQKKVEGFCFLIKILLERISTKEIYILKKIEYLYVLVSVYCIFKKNKI